jgi:hypothetical protein
VIAASVPVDARAGEATAEGLGSHWVPISTERLDRMRGGYRLPTGLEISFGIERVVFVDGQLVSVSRLTIADVSRISPEQAQVLSDLERTTVVQVGGANVSAAVGGHGLVVQNSIDGRAIQVSTTLDIGVGTLGVFQQWNASSALQSALNAAPGAL